ncbi:MAG TPA: hypothetical protein VLH85_07855 [Levilinea sp.]|nr:hypothetical protein [Levilinea sp.]
MQAGKIGSDPTELSSRAAQYAQAAGIDFQSGKRAGKRIQQGSPRCFVEHAALEMQAAGLH